MTYDARTSSIDAGNPVQLFRFTYGSLSAEVLAYTTHTDEITVDHGAPVGEITYLPVPVQRDNIVSSGSLDNSAVKVSLDIGTEIAELFRIYPPSSVMSLVIYEGHLDDPDEEFLVIWSGRVVAVSRRGSELQLSAEPIATQMRRSGLRRHYQLGCPLILYGKDLGLGTCEASKAAGTVQGIIAGISGTMITLEPGWEYGLDPAKFIRGSVEWQPAGRSTEYRTILRVSGDNVSLSGIPSGLEIGDPIDLVLGCNHRAFAVDGGDCEALHNALPSYGGHPFIPIVGVINKNPFY
jgi:hypothetical protein